MLKLDYYEPDAFNQSEDPSEAFHIQGNAGPECQYCESQFLSNNKLHNHLQEICKGRHTAFANSIKTGLITIPHSKEKENLQSVVFQGILIVHLSINPSTDIRTGYGFRGYHYLKNRMALLLSSLSDTMCFDTGCSVTLYNSSFFWSQAPNTPIRKMAISITILGLEANQHATDKYTISDIYIPAKNTQEQLVTAHIRREVHLVPDLKSNMLIETDIMTPKQFVLDLSKKSAFIGSCFYKFNLDIKTP